MSISVSASGMSNAQFREDVHAHNVANLDTPGFKALQVKTTEAQDGGTIVSAVTRLETPGRLFPPELTVSNGVTVHGDRSPFVTGKSTSASSFPRRRESSLEQGRRVPHTGFPPSRE